MVTIPPEPAFPGPHVPPCALTLWKGPWQVSGSRLGMLHLSRQRGLGSPSCPLSLCPSPALSRHRGQRSWYLLGRSFSSHSAPQSSSLCHCTFSALAMSPWTGKAQTVLQSWGEIGKEIPFPPRPLWSMCDLPPLCWMASAVTCRTQIPFLLKKWRQLVQGKELTGRKDTWVPVPAWSSACFKTFSGFFCP